MHPLSGVRVVEIGDRLAVNYCGKLLRDAGADVVKVEREQGDSLRRYRPVGATFADERADSAFFSYLAGGKRSVVASEASPVPHRLLAEADIVVVAATPAQTRQLGIDVKAIVAAFPTCVVVTVSSFGWTGPWVDFPATEFTLQAWCGSTGSRGVPERPPVCAGGELGEFIAGGYAAFFALAAHYGRGGGHVDLSVLEAMTSSMQTFGWLRKDVAGLQSFTRSVEVPSIERAKDGYVGVSMATDQQWLNFCAMVDCPELADMAELRFQLGRWRHRDRVHAAIDPWFGARTVAEIVDVAERYRVPMAAIGNGATLTGMDQFRQRGVYVEHPAGFRQPRPPWTMSEASPCPIAAAPALGAHDACQEMWAPREAHSASAPTGNVAPGQSLRGIRVVDLTAFWAGPFATQLFASLGADVIKIESVQRPDGMRYSGGLRDDVEEWWEYSWVFHAVNSNKRAVTLDLQSPEGKALFGRLVSDADVVIENFPARVMEHLGLDYDELKRRNENVIFVRMPAFGLDGPWRDRGGFAMTMEQIAGLAWLTGYADDTPTAPRGPCDPLAAVHAAFVCLCALEYRRRTGRGQLVEVPMIETVLNATALQVIEYDVAGSVLERRGNRGHRYAIQDVYPCAGDEQWIAVSIRGDGDWAALLDAIGVTHCAVGRSATEQDRWCHAEEIDASLTNWFRSQPLAQTVRALIAAGIPAAPVVLPTDVGDNPQLRARAFLETLHHPLCGPIRYPRPPITPPTGRDHFIDHPAPMLGQHNAQILRDAMGLTADEFSALELDEVIGTRPTPR